MIKNMKTGVAMLLMASLTLGSVSSCKDEDPNYDNVTPPTIEVVAHSVSGIIFAKNGSTIANATVTLGQNSTTTDDKGVYKFADVKSGKYIIKVEAEGMLPIEGELEVNDDNKTHYLHWNATLSSNSNQKAVVEKNVVTQLGIVTESIKGNEKASINIDVFAPVNIIEAEEGAEIIVSPIYEGRTLTRSIESTMIVGSKLSCTDQNAKLLGKMDLEFSLDSDLAQKVVARAYKNGQWKTAESKILEDGRVVVYADAFTSYGLFIDVDYKTKKFTETILDEKFDNLYGAFPLVVGKVPYTYKSGMDIHGGQSILEALLVEKLVAKYGLNVVEQTNDYPVNVVLPVGTLMKVLAQQLITNISAEAAGTTVSGNYYYAVSVSSSVVNRQHEGGTN